MGQASEAHHEKAKKKKGKEMSGDRKAVRRLRTACERAKRIISIFLEADIETIFDGIELLSTVTRAGFEDLIIDLCIKSMDLVKSFLSNSQSDGERV